MGEKPMRNLTIRVNTDAYSLFQLRAMDMGCSLSQWVRRACLLQLDPKMLKELRGVRKVGRPRTDEEELERILGGDSDRGPSSEGTS